MTAYATHLRKIRDNELFYGRDKASAKALYDRQGRSRHSSQISTRGQRPNGSLGEGVL